MILVYLSRQAVKCAFLRVIGVLTAAVTDVATGEVDMNC
jgi:hypothetical protein